MSATAAPRAPIERTVEHANGALHVVDRRGEEPAIGLMHGFPGDHHIYDRLVELLAPRRVVAFDCSRDTYLSVNVAQRLAQMLGTADVHLIDSASHWPQWDEPNAVASILEGVLRAP